MRFRIIKHNALSIAYDNVLVVPVDVSIFTSLDEFLNLQAWEMWKLFEVRSAIWRVKSVHPLISHPITIVTYTILRLSYAHEFFTRLPVENLAYTDGLNWQIDKYVDSSLVSGIYLMGTVHKWRARLYPYILLWVRRWKTYLRSICNRNRLKSDYYWKCIVKSKWSRYELIVF